MKNFSFPRFLMLTISAEEDFNKQMHEATLLIQDKQFTAALNMWLPPPKSNLPMHSAARCVCGLMYGIISVTLCSKPDRKEESYACCQNIIDELSKIALWPYLEEFNPIRAALRAAHNNLAYRCYETATDLKGIKEGLNHIKTTMKTVAPIEEKETLNQFYETHALLLHKATFFDATYQKDLDKVVARIKKLKLREAGLLTDELLSKSRALICLYTTDLRGGGRLMKPFCS